mgnify:CR=1 FL=1
MDYNNFMEQLKDVSTLTKAVSVCFVILGTYYIFIKISDLKNIKNIYKLIIFISIPIISMIVILVQKMIDLYYGYMLLLFLITLVNAIYSKLNITNNIIITTISLSLNFIIYIIAVMLSFVPKAIFQINDYLSLIIIQSIYWLLLCYVFKARRFKYGISFLKNKLENLYFSIIILHISTMLLLAIIILQSYNFFEGRKVGITLVILALFLIITLKETIQVQYKQNLLEKDLKNTKEELENKKQEIEKLEKENLEFSKTSHSLAHKQKALEYRLSQLTKLGKINEDEEKGIKKELENISEEMYREPEDIELAKTDIPSIDNMFLYMQSECVKDNIKFELQVVGNIHYMVNNLISENELEILIADHLKDAIIAINYSDNSNRSILVRIGKIDNVYSLYIYDSGIEFTKEVLDNLGKKPITTHADTGGTGMGFMNTFDTLNKTKASLIINEIGEPCKDNYTKVLIFKFDNQNEFKVNSYKNEIVV